MTGGRGNRRKSATNAVIVRLLVAVFCFLSLPRVVVCQPEDLDRVHAVTHAASDAHRIVRESPAPYRRKTHVTMVDVGELVGGVEGPVRTGWYQHVVGAVFGAWRPRYVRVRCADGAGASVGFGCIGWRGGSGRLWPSVRRGRLLIEHRFGAGGHTRSIFTSRCVAHRSLRMAVAMTRCGVGCLCRWGPPVWGATRSRRTSVQRLRAVC